MEHRAVKRGSRARPVAGMRIMSTRPANRRPHSKHILKALQLNLEFLDELVTDYQVTSSQENAESSVLQAAEEIKRLAAAGYIERAIAEGAQLAPTLFQDQYFLFKLKQQQFVEYLRGQTPEDKDRAIEFLRTELAPLALNAHPDAYTELKQCLLTLVIPEAAQQSSCRQEWDPKKREMLAAQLCRAVRQARGVTECNLSLILRYLALVTASLRDTTVPPLELDELADMDLVNSLRVDPSSRAPPPPPPEDFQITSDVRSAVSRVPNSQIVMFKSVFGVAREDVINSLRLAEGQLPLAFKYELSALCMNKAAVGEMVREYAASRCLGSADNGLTSEEAELLHERRNSGQQSSASHTRSEPGPHSAGADVSQGSGGRDSSRSPPKKVTRRDVAPPSPQPQVALQANNQRSGSSCELFELRTSVESGQIPEAVAGIQKLAPEFFGSHPELAFELYAVHFQQLLQAGETKAALEVARGSMAAISIKHAALQPKLKAALSTLIPGGVAASDTTRLSTLADIVQNELRLALGLEEPKLVRLLKMLLLAHQHYFRLNQCDDPFEGVLDLDLLRQGPRLGAREAIVPKSPVADEHTVAQGNGLPASSSRVVPMVALEEIPTQFEEEVVLEAMEITNLGRAAVMNMLRDVGGSLEALVDHLFL